MTSTVQDFIGGLRQKCQQDPGIIALPESDDPRVLAAAGTFLGEKSFSKVILFGERAQLQAACDRVGDKDLLQHPGIMIAGEFFPDLPDRVSHHFAEYLKQRGKSADEQLLAQQAQSTLAQAGELLHLGHCDVVIGGAVLTTAEVIRSAISTVGLRSGYRTVSGSFLLNRAAKNSEETLLFADCGVVIEPKINQLVDIARQSSETFTLITGAEPRVAFLSFSTAGSAAAESVDRIKEAVRLFRERFPEIAADGEMQFDAAYVPDIARRKCPESSVAGRANVFIFPDLNSGNISYKIAQRLGGFAAYGPILQGLAKPFSDLSRGTSTEEIIASGYINYLRRNRSQT